MIITNVKIDNFYCFLGTNDIPLVEGLNIISAANSGGKSQLFNAFYWALFDKIYADIDNSSGKKEWKSSHSINVCPAKLKNDAKESERITCSVEINLKTDYHLNEHPAGELVGYTFLKKVVYEKSRDSLITYSKPELIISFVREGETEFIPNHQHSWFLDKIFPSSIRKFMWYQGETMDDLYDFSKPSTLKNAIKEISYFPMYDNMEKIVKASSTSIEKKIEKELNLQNRLSTNQQKLLNDINSTTKTVELKEEQINDLKKDLDNLQDDIADVEHQLKSYDKYRDLKEQLLQLQSDVGLTKSRIDDADIYVKETLINKWMLNGCEDLINASEKNLDIVNKEIQDFQKNSNPIPMSLPGPEYVETMLKDHICYICERPVEDNTAAYEALKKRLNDFEKNSNYKLLQDSYTELNRARKRLINDLPEIKKEISANNQKRDELIKKRNSLNKKIKSLYEVSGDEDGAAILSAGTTASQLLAKMQNFRNSINTKSKTISFLQSEVEKLKEELDRLKIERDKIIKTVDANNLVESTASDYIKMFVKSIGQLRSIAYSKLIQEIQLESNRLYSLYLGGKPQGEIVINNGIQIIDKVTREVLTELNTAELVAQKLAVANAFLSLSEKKMHRTYPIVADAPTSDFDPENTYNLTINIGQSFEQMIIMSKDYSSMSKEKRDELIRDAKVAKYYEFKNDKIEKDGADSRINRKTYINIIK
jgi:DNA sulfur modification protein DndD